MDVAGLKMEDTELNLGLGLGLGPGPGKTTAGNKRGFSETVVDLKLNLNNNDNDNNNNNNNNDSSLSSDLDQTASSDLMMIKNDKNKSGDGVNGEDHVNNIKVNSQANHADPAKPPAKAQVVGWPPVRSYRKNMVTVQKSAKEPESETEKPAVNGGLVKVSMDGAPYLRKVDLKLYKSYQDLSHALGKMFSSFTLGNYGAQGMIDFMNESKLMDLINGSDYVPTYEDKDGDWMLVGDVPWEMFVESCKRLRIMKGKEAAGLAPRAMEKCKKRI